MHRLYYILRSIAQNNDVENDDTTVAFNRKYNEFVQWLTQVAPENTPSIPAIATKQSCTLNASQVPAQSEPRQVSSTTDTYVAPANSKETPRRATALESRKEVPTQSNVLDTIDSATAATMLAPKRPAPKSTTVAKTVKKVTKPFDWDVYIAKTAVKPQTPTGASLPKSKAFVDYQNFSSMLESIVAQYLSITRYYNNIHIFPIANILQCHRNRHRAHAKHAQHQITVFWTKLIMKQLMIGTVTMTMMSTASHMIQTNGLKCY